MALNYIDAAVESFQQALELEPNDGLCFCMSSSLIVTLLFTNVTSGFCFDILQEELSENLLLQRRRLVYYFL